MKRKFHFLRTPEYLPVIHFFKLVCRFKPMHNLVERNLLNLFKCVFIFYYDKCEFYAMRIKHVCKLISAKDNVLKTRLVT